MKNKLILIVLLFLVLQSCISGVHSFNNINTANVNTVVQLSESNFKVVRYVKGESSSKYIFGIGGISNKSLVERAKADMHKNAQLDDKSRTIINQTFELHKSLIFFFSKKSVIVSGHVIEFIDKNRDNHNNSSVENSRETSPKFSKNTDNVAPVGNLENTANSPKNLPPQSLPNNTNNSSPEKKLDVNQEIDNYNNSSNDNKTNSEIPNPNIQIKNTPTPEQRELNNTGIKLFENPLKSTIKKYGSIFFEPNFNKEVIKINAGTAIEVLGYGNGFWKVRLNEISGYVDSSTVYITFEMAKYIR